MYEFAPKVLAKGSYNLYFYKLYISFWMQMLHDLIPTCCAIRRCQVIILALIKGSSKGT